MSYDQPQFERAVSDALNTLGDTADTVRANLVKEGCKGVVGSSCYCPVAVYLKKKLNVSAVGVARSRVWSYVDPMKDDTRLTATPPQAIADFISVFDCRCYPELETQLETQEV